MTREELLAQVGALDEIAEHLDGLHLLQSRDECLKKARELRAQAEAMPSAAQQAAWMYQHEETGNVTFRPHNERWVDHRRYVEIPLYAAPPDLAARVKELEELLRECLEYFDGSPVVALNMAPRIRAALAEGER